MGISSKHILFILLFATYGSGILGRKSLTAALPALLRETALSMSDAGMLSSLFSRTLSSHDSSSSFSSLIIIILLLHLLSIVFYAVGRFAAGVAMDRYEASTVLSLALLCTGTLPSLIHLHDHDVI